MTARESEADLRPSTEPSIACTSTAQLAGIIVSGTLFSPISSVIWLNVTVAGTMIFHLLDGTSLTQAFPVGFFVLSLQCDTITNGTATATYSALSSPS
jgi:hypothetical protein